MAIIKCPECGRQISDKAPACPNCGVQIAGKIIRCPQCGDVYFNDQEVCPNCHHQTRVSGQTGHSDAPTPHDDQPEQPQQPRKKGHAAIIAGFVFALLVCAICFYFYNNAKTSKEEEAYEFAMKSDDPLVLQTYLDTNLDAPEAHRDAITARLEQLKQQDNDWTNAVVSGSKAALEDYLMKHPDSDHKLEAQHKIDSIDWSDASNENTMEAMNLYLSQHPNGEHVDEANTAIKKLKANTVQPEEKSMVAAILRHFFQSINSRSESDLQATVAPLLTNFLGKTDATKADVLTFMNKIYKDDITNMNWRLNNDYKIDKKEVGDEQYEYTVNFSARQTMERTDASKEKEANYRVKATISPDGLISAMSMTKILE